MGSDEYARAQEGESVSKTMSAGFGDTRSKGSCIRWANGVRQARAINRGIALGDGLRCGGNSWQGIRSASARTTLVSTSQRTLLITRNLMVETPGQVQAVTRTRRSWFCQGQPKKHERISAR